MITYEVESNNDKSKLWVHSSEGISVARFSNIGCDIPYSIEEVESGAPHYRFFIAGQPSMNDWETFKAKAVEFWGIELSDSDFDCSLLGSTSASITYSH